MTKTRWALVAALLMLLAPTGCASPASPQSTPSNPPSASQQPTPAPRAMGQAEARATAYGMFVPTEGHGTVSSTDADAETVCGNLEIGNDDGWFVADEDAPFGVPEGTPVNSKRVYAAWPLAASELSEVDKTLAAITSCAGTTESRQDVGKPVALEGFSGPAAGIHATEGEQSFAMMMARVGSLLVLCLNIDKDAAVVDQGLAECMARARSAATIALSGDIAESRDPLARLMVASRVQLEGFRTLPAPYGVNAPCARGDHPFLSEGAFALVALMRKDGPGGAPATVAVELAADSAAAKAAVARQQDSAADCTGEYQHPAPSNMPSLTTPPLHLSPGRVTDAGDGGVAFTAEQTLAGQPFFDHAEAFSLGAYKVQVSTNAGSAEEAQSQAQQIIDLLEGSAGK